MAQEISRLAIRALADQLKGLHALRPRGAIGEHFHGEKARRWQRDRKAVSSCRVSLQCCRHIFKALDQGLGRTIQTAGNPLWYDAQKEHVLKAQAKSAGALAAKVCG